MQKKNSKLKTRSLNSNFMINSQLSQSHGKQIKIYEKHAFEGSMNDRKGI